MSYGRLCTLFCDTDKPAPPPKELDFYTRFLGSASAAGTILEPMCGSGRFLVPLLRLGYDVHGFDRSASMIDACTNRLRSAGHPPNRVQVAGLTEYNAAAVFDRAIIPAGSFSLLAEDQDVQTSLHRLRGLLKPGGQLCLEICTLGDSAPSAGEGQRSLAIGEGKTIVLTTKSHWDAERSVEVVACTYQVIRKGEILTKESERIEVRLWRVADFKMLVPAFGLRVVDCNEGDFGDSRAALTLTPSMA